MQTTLRIVTDAIGAELPAPTLAAFAPMAESLRFEESAATSGDQTAADLLAEVSGVLALLSEQCEHHELRYFETQQRTEADLTSAKLQAEHWRKFALTLRVKLNRLTSELPLWQDRADIAERRVEATRALTQTAKQAAAETEAVAALFPILQARGGAATSAADPENGLRHRLDTVVTWMDSLRNLTKASDDAARTVGPLPGAA